MEIIRLDDKQHLADALIQSDCFIVFIKKKNISSWKFTGSGIKSITIRIFSEILSGYFRLASQLVLTVDTVIMYDYYLKILSKILWD